MVSFVVAKGAIAPYFGNQQIKRNIQHLPQISYINNLINDHKHHREKVISCWKSGHHSGTILAHMKARLTLPLSNNTCM